MIYVFDIDGTLTPSRGLIDSEFASWFNEFVQSHRVCFVTGSDPKKSQEQLGQALWNRAEYSFNCAGNEVYQQGQLVHSSSWACPADLWQWLETRLWSSPYPHRSGRHFETRTGMLNFSVVGRNAQGIERANYHAWDRDCGERENLAREINARWPNIQAVVGGETGIDIFARGRDKAQILSWFEPGEDLAFFGDRMDPAGNDYSLAQAILTNKRGECYHVRDWKHTWQLLRELDDNNLLPQGRS